MNINRGNFIWFVFIGLAILNNSINKPSEISVINSYHSGALALQVVKVLSEKEVGNNGKLILYKTADNALAVAFLKKKSFSLNWELVGFSSGIPLDYKLTQKWRHSKTMPQTEWKWTNLKDFGIYTGVIYDKDIKKITVNDLEANVVTSHNYYVWYKVGELEQATIKGYNDSGSLVYEYSFLQIPNKICFYYGYRPENNERSTKHSCIT